MFIVAVRDRDARKTLILNEFDTHEEWVEAFTAATLKANESPSLEVVAFVGGSKEEFLADHPEYET